LVPDTKPPSFALSLAGGGFRGLFTIEFLSLLENEVGPLKNKVSFIAGTSVGAINGIGLALGHSAETIRDQFIGLGEGVFPPEYIPFKAMAEQAFKSGKRDPQKLSEAIKDITGDKTLKDVEIPIAVTAVDITAGRARIFKHRALGGDESDQKIPLVDIAMASAAAPTYFPPHKIDPKIYVDGGLFANAPDLTTAAELLNYQKEPAKRRMISISAADTNQALASSKKTASLKGVDWANPMNPILLQQIMAAQASYARECAKRIIGSRYVASVAPHPSTSQDEVLELDRADADAQKTLRGLAIDAYNDFLDRYRDPWISELKL